MIKIFINILFFQIGFIFFVSAQYISGFTKAEYPDKYYYRPVNLFPDTLNKSKNKNCCNTWCFGTSAVPMLNIASYNSFLLNEKVKFYGLKLGIVFGGRVRAGIGAFKLSQLIDLEPLVTDAGDVNRQLMFEYYNFFSDIVFYKDFRWELSIPLSIGKAFGKIDTFSVRDNNKRAQTDVDSTALATLGFDFEYRFIPWIGIGGGAGYRQAFAPKEIREKLNAPFYVVKLKIFIGYLFKSIFRKKKLIEEREAYKREKEERKKKKKEKKTKKKQSGEIEGFDKPENKSDY